MKVAYGNEEPDRESVSENIQKLTEELRGQYRLLSQLTPSEIEMDKCDERIANLGYQLDKCTCRTGHKDDGNPICPVHKCRRR